MLLSQSPSSLSGRAAKTRTALIASADPVFRQRLNETLTGLRWYVREADCGAQAWTESENQRPEAIIVDSWLPDLNHEEFLNTFRTSFPGVDMLVANSSASQTWCRGPHRQELFYALRSCQREDTVVWNSAAIEGETSRSRRGDEVARSRVMNPLDATAATSRNLPDVSTEIASKSPISAVPVSPESGRSSTAQRLPDFIGEAACMLEVSRRIRLVAPRTTPVLIEGPTGSGKELVAEALHRLSPRSHQPFVAINCAAIPEALLEAELFGHTRGAFTGAVQRRIGRIEAADGGTLFLDEIGEMPLALQAKLLRFVESGEVQRVGDNETLKVDVRVVAATHRPLAQHTQTGAFRADLYYRLAVFLIRTPALKDHREDIRLLVDHFLARIGKRMPVKQIDAGTLERLVAHDWPGNVRELEHVLERAAILAGDAPVITEQEIDFGLAVN